MTRHIADRTFATSRIARIGAAVAAGTVLLVGCSSTADSTGSAAAVSSASSTGSSSAGSTSGSTSGDAGSGSGAGDSGTRPAQIPSASGTIAALTGTTLQVQGADSQTSVTFGGSTAITTTVTAVAADVSVGSCIVATAAGTDTTDPTTSSTGTTTQSPALATGGVTATGPLTATGVVISDAVDGACTQTGGMGGGGAPGGAMPTDGAVPDGAVPDGAVPDGAMPEGSPADGGTPPAGGGMGGFGSRVAGLVTAVDGDTVTVTTAGQDAGSSTVTVTDATTYSRTVAGDAAALVVGQCARATGTEDSSGAIAATTIAVTEPSSTGCSTATGRGGRMGGNRPGTATTSSANG